MLYAAPQPVMVGDQTQASEITDYLQRAGYTESNRNRLGWYHVRPDAVEINPGPEAYDNEGAVIKIDHGKVTQIISLRDHTQRTQYDEWYEECHHDAQSNAPIELVGFELEKMCFCYHPVFLLTLRNSRQRATLFSPLVDHHIGDHRNGEDQNIIGPREGVHL